MSEWSFLTNHARILVCIAHDPGVRLRDLAATVGINERSAFAIVTDLTAAGYVVKAKDGRRNRYQIQSHLPLREAMGPEQTIGEVLDVSPTPAPTIRPAGLAADTWARRRCHHTAAKRQLSSCHNQRLDRQKDNPAGSPFCRCLLLGSPIYHPRSTLNGGDRLVKGVH